MGCDKILESDLPTRSAVCKRRGPSLARSTLYPASLESNPPGELTFNAPVHVLSRDAAFVERFADAGFQPGLFAEPGKAPALQHEGLFSLWVKKLAEAYGTPETRDRATWFPDGIGLAGLNASL